MCSYTAVYWQKRGTFTGPLKSKVSCHSVKRVWHEFKLMVDCCACVPFQVGVQNYSAASNCPSRPSHTRSDYGKLFVVLVIIGSICMVIITSGFIYICWQRRLPATKTAVSTNTNHRHALTVARADVQLCCQVFKTTDVCQCLQYIYIILSILK